MATRSTASSPAEDSEIWAAVLSDPLDLGMSCSTPPSKIYATYVDDGMMDINQLLEGSQEDEHELERWLEGSSSPTSMKEMNLAHKAGPETTLREKEGTCAASTVNLLDYMRKNGWRRRCGPRGHRKRRTMLSTETLLRNHFRNAARLQDMPSASKGRRHGLRRNNEHWTPKEVTKLVDGVEKYGVGPWTQLKEDKFSTSVRTTMHLKDKWRNLVKPPSKKKGNAKKRFLVPLNKALIKRIQKLAAKYPYPKSRRTSE